MCYECDNLSESLREVLVVSKFSSMPADVACLQMGREFVQRFVAAMIYLYKQLNW